MTLKRAIRAYYQRPPQFGSFVHKCHAANAGTMQVPCIDSQERGFQSILACHKWREMEEQKSGTPLIESSFLSRPLAYTIQYRRCPTPLAWSEARRMA